MNLSLNEKQILKRKKRKSSEKYVQNLKNTVKGILLLCDKMPDKKPEDPTGILAWKLSLPIMSNKAIDKLLTRSIEKGPINNEKELTMNFVRDLIFGNIRSVTHYHCRMVMEKKGSSIPTFD